MLNANVFRWLAKPRFSTGRSLAAPLAPLDESQDAAGGIDLAGSPTPEETGEVDVFAFDYYLEHYGWMYTDPWLWGHVVDKLAADDLSDFYEDLFDEGAP